MAGVLIYTAAPDSEGTLGGLVSLGETDTLGRHLDQALEAMRLCASDPLCAEHHPYRDGTTLHGAACHACMFLPETSCERGNKYLDRSVLVKTLDKEDLAFFDDNVEEVKQTDRKTKHEVASPIDRTFAAQVISEFLTTHPGSTTAQVKGELIRQMGQSTEINDSVLETLLQDAGHQENTAAGSTVWQPSVGATDEVAKASNLDDLLEFCDERCKPSVKSLAAQGKELPVVGYELTDEKGGVCADAELAWPSKKIAVLLDEAKNADQFEQQGWKVFTTADLSNEEFLTLL
jgi:hypothetical protein